MIYLNEYFYLLESNPTDSIVMIGRYQPFTLGHLKLYELCKQKYKNTIIGMSVKADKTLDINNPFTDSERMKFIKSSIPGIKVIKVVGLNYKSVWHAAGMETALGVGQDREPILRQMGGAKDGSGRFEYFVVPRTGRNISATKVRQAALNDNFDAFKRMTALGIHKDFEFIQKRLSSLT